MTNRAFARDPGSPDGPGAVVATGTVVWRVAAQDPHLGQVSCAELTLLGADFGSMRCVFREDQIFTRSVRIAGGPRKSSRQGSPGGSVRYRGRSYAAEGHRAVATLDHHPPPCRLHACEGRGAPRTGPPPRKVAGPVRRGTQAQCLDKLLSCASPGTGLQPPYGRYLKISLEIGECCSKTG